MEDEVDAAWQLAGAGRYDEAAAVLERLFAVGWRDAGAYHLYAHCQLLLGNPAAMLTAADWAYALDPNSVWGRRLRALALTFADSTEEAIVVAQGATRQSQDWQSYVTLALCLLGETRLRAAVRAAHRAAELAPGEPVVHIIRGDFQVAYGKVEAARASYRRALSLDPGHVEATQRLYGVAENVGRFGRIARMYAADAASAPWRVGDTSTLPKLASKIGQRSWFTGVWLMLVLMFGLFPAAWALAAVLVGAYVGWLAFLLRRLSAAERTFLAICVRLDTALHMSLLGTAMTVPTALGIGLYELISQDERGSSFVVILCIVLGVYLLTTIGPITIRLIRYGVAGLPVMKPPDRTPG